MEVLLLLPFGLQAVAMLLDEFRFHHRRDLPRWERIGHPIDTAFVLACYALVLFLPYSRTALWCFIAVGALSCFVITKDEWVHHAECEAAEQWLHAFLFVLHPVVLVCLALLWPFHSGENPSWAGSAESLGSLVRIVVPIQVSVMVIFWIYQVVYWNWVRPYPETGASGRPQP